MSAGDLLYSCCRSKYNEHRLNKTVEEGTKPEVKESLLRHFPRPEIVKYLEKAFKPNEDQSFYHVVCGWTGTGKTTLIRTASRNVGQGVIYVDVPADLN